MSMIVERESRGGGGSTSVELHEGATRITVQEVYDWVVANGLDPSGVYISPEFTCYGEGQDHDKYMGLMWTLSNRHPKNNPRGTTGAPVKS
jgi:hypothetical protein